MFTKLGTGCPICNGQRRGHRRGGGECKQAPSGLIFCITGKELSLPTGWRQVGEDKHGLFGIFSDSAQGISDEQREELRRQRAAERKRLEAEESRRRQDALTSQERDKEIRKLLSQLSLDERDRKDLKRRGLSDEQIKAGQFVSIEPWQRLEFPVSPRLAGVDITGQSLCNPQAGYICPIRDAAGLLISWQLRLRESDDGGKYRWPSSQTRRRPKGPTSHQKNGELPIAVCLPSENVKGKLPGFTEGVLKPWIAAQLGNIPVIGAAGGQWTSSPKSLRSAVEALATQTGSNKFLLYPDGGAVTNKNVMRQYDALHTTLSNWGYELAVVWYGQTTKDDPDIDELLAAGNGHLIREITWEDFKAIADGDVKQAIGLSNAIAKIRANELWKLSHPVTWQCNQRYLEGLPIPSEGLAFIKSAKGTGKTYNLKDIAEIAAQEGRKVLLLTHRIVLGRAICSVVELTWIEDRFTSDEDKLNSQLFGYGLCVDSLHPNSQAKFNPEDWKGIILFIDELEQVIWHLLNSSTCQSDRIAILDTFKSLINVVLESGGLIIGQDADLTDISIDFIIGMKEGEKPQPWIAVNDYKPQEPWLITNYDTQSGEGQKDNPTALLRDVANHVNDGGKAWMQLDAQKAKSTYGTTNLEKYFAKECPGAKILRIDQTTVSNPQHPAYKCSDSINEIAKDYDIVICSPSLATGVSVTLRSHFTVVVGIFQGACPDNEVRQALSRVREAVPRWIWIRQKAVAEIGNGSSSWFEVAKSKEKDVRYNLQLLKDYEFNLEGNFDPLAFRTWAKMAARINASVWDYRNSVIEGLIAEGHTIQTKQDTDNSITEVFKTIRQESQIKEAELVATADDIDWKEYEALSRKRSKTDAERYTEEKYTLKERYGVEVTPELRQLSQDSWHPRIRLHYYLSHNPEYLKMREWKHIEGHLNRGNGKLCPQDVKLLQAKVAVHQVLGVLKFTNPDGEWTKDSLDVVDFIAKALKIARDIKDICSISVSPERAQKDPIGIINAFLKQLGLTLIGEQRRKGDERERVYRFRGTAKVNVYTRDCLIGKTIPEPEGLRHQIFDHWKTRDTEALAKWQADMACPVSGLAVTPFSENVTATTKNINTENAVTKNSTNPIEKVWGVGSELVEVAAQIAKGALQTAKNCLEQAVKVFGIEKVFDALDLLPDHQRLAIEGLG